MRTGIVGPCFFRRSPVWLREEMAQSQRTPQTSDDGLAKRSPMTSSAMLTILPALQEKQPLPGAWLNADLGLADRPEAQPTPPRHRVSIVVLSERLLTLCPVSWGGALDKVHASDSCLLPSLPRPPVTPAPPGSPPSRVPRCLKAAAGRGFLGFLPLLSPRWFPAPASHALRSQQRNVSTLRTEALWGGLTVPDLKVRVSRRDSQLRAPAPAGGGAWWGLRCPAASRPESGRVRPPLPPPPAPASRADCRSTEARAPEEQSKEPSPLHLQVPCCRQPPLGPFSALRSCHSLASCLGFQRFLFLRPSLPLGSKSHLPSAQHSCK
uniref:Uncharacterized protein LOC110193113 n=1 Tax=Phascolarctos cinereus TaxID=38626 RepID=A0A6P5IDT9_PHACI|nr:uncharacterized protein LOC110193113 [Phascolarctos cinereus]